MDGNFSNNALGVGAVFAWNDHIQAGNAQSGHLSEAEKEHVIFKCKDAKTEEEKEKILNSLSPEDMDSIGDVVQGPGIG